jgi:hypothetical protein
MSEFGYENLPEIKNQSKLMIFFKANLKLKIKVVTN